ncbi:MAG TPA: hypothetical protein VK673_06930 [Chthoniobacterales bacterium]|nr:hypothetical protein [Chthoniobacterales bacterium]
MANNLTYVDESGYEDAVINFCEGLYAFGYGLTGNQDGAACRAALVLPGNGRFSIGSFSVNDRIRVRVRVKIPARLPLKL